MTVLRPLPGDPATVRALADRLQGRGERLLSLASALRGLSGPDIAWASPAEAAFAARSHAAAALLVSAGRRHGVSAATLRPLAAALEHAQQVVGAAVAEHSVAHPRAVALGTARVEAEQSADPARRASAVGLHCREVAELERAQDAERRHSRAWRDFQEADRRCAAVLHRLLDDGLADSRAYDALTGLSRAAAGVEGVAGTVALFPSPPTKAFGVAAGAAGATRVAADAVVKVAYGDGDWTSIGLSAAALGTGRAAGVLKRGALATNPAARSAATRTERRLLRHDVQQRLGQGLAAELRQVGRVGAKAPPRPFRAPRPLSSVSSPAATAHWVAEQVAGRARHAAQVRWLDDLALATRDPARSRTMLLSGFGAQAASSGLGGAGALRDHHLDHEAGEAERRRDERSGAQAASGPARPR
ncbi:hypothetical protein GCM10009845_09350 [Pedococcus bigeumensis]